MKEVLLTALNHATSLAAGETGVNVHQTLLPTLTLEARETLMEIVATRPPGETLVHQLIQATEDRCAETA